MKRSLPSDDLRELAQLESATKKTRPAPRLHLFIADPTGDFGARVFSWNATTSGKSAIAIEQAIEKARQNGDGDTVAFHFCDHSAASQMVDADFDRDPTSKKFRKDFGLEHIPSRDYGFWKLRTNGVHEGPFVKVWNFINPE